jgi:hypothetical protein
MAGRGGVRAVQVREIFTQMFEEAVIQSSLFFPGLAPSSPVFRGAPFEPDEPDEPRDPSHVVELPIYTARSLKHMAKLFRQDFQPARHSVQYLVEGWQLYRLSIQ